MPRNKPNNRPHGKSSNPLGRLRIIAGRWRSRQLPVLDQAGLRPTTDRVRETLFNWLQAEIPGAKCLDLFAGSGALGFEAASRGASQVVMIEQQADAANVLADNIKQLDADNIRLLRQDAMQWLQAPNEQFDVVFIDPPYDSEVLAECCRLLEQNHGLVDGAMVYLELSSKQALPELPTNWQIIHGKKAGLVSYHLAIRDKQE